MNERIQELMEQSSAGACHDVETNTLIGTEIERFAELIITECAGFLRDTLDDHFAAEQLEEHFGV
jgi:hypothetical protein